MVSALRRLHRLLGILCIALWTLQIGSGIALVFHREMAWLPLQSEAHSFDAARFANRVTAIAAERGVAPSAVFSLTGGDDRFLLQFGDDLGPRAVDGLGQAIDGRPLLGPEAQLTLLRFHRHLLLGSRGEWLVAISGALLMIQLLAGWRLARRPARGGANPDGRGARRWHRQGGRWLAPLILLPLCCGVLLVFEGRLQRALGVAEARPASAPSRGDAQIDAAEAIARAIARYPDSRFVGMQWPEAGWPHFTVFLLQLAEPAQTYGATRVVVDAHDGRIAAASDPLARDAVGRALGLLYPLHSGQIGGWPGRLLILLLGVALLSLAGLGLRLAMRRHSTTARRTCNATT